MARLFFKMIDIKVSTVSSHVRDNITIDKKDKNKIDKYKFHKEDRKCSALEIYTHRIDKVPLIVMTTVFLKWSTSIQNGLWKSSF